MNSFKRHIGAMLQDLVVLHLLLKLNTSCFFINISVIDFWKPMLIGPTLTLTCLTSTINILDDVGDSYDVAINFHQGLTFIEFEQAIEYINHNHKNAHQNIKKSRNHHEMH